MADRIRLLSTGTLDTKSVERAMARGFDVELIPFIKTEPIVDILTRELVAKQIDSGRCLVFTSANTVDALAKMGFFDLNNCGIYSLSGATSSAIASNFNNFRILGEANSASELAHLIVDNRESDIAFLCGDKRLMDLPQTLLSNGIDLNEIVVYKTNFTPHTINGYYDGLLFYSPSAVDCFFSLNSIKKGVAIFSIGSTTTYALTKHTILPVFMPDAPSKQGVLDLAIKTIINSRKETKL